MRKLKDLTQDECIEIAKIINPDVNWEFILPDIVWNGFDLVDKISYDKNNVQISYDDTDNHIFREFDEKLCEVRIPDRTVYKIILYLQSINVEI